MEQHAQLAILFACGFLVSRLMVKAGLPERVVGAMIRHHVSHAGVIFYLISGTALLSLLIPNAITAITVLPVVTLVRDRLVAGRPESAARVTTLLALSVIYGANIGGMGSITGTAANGVLAVYAAVEGVDDHGLLRYDRWLPWGVPLVVVMVLACWAVVCVSAGARLARAPLGVSTVSGPRGRLERLAWWTGAGFVAVAFALSAAMGQAGNEALILGATLLLAVLLWTVLLAGRVRGARILELRDCYHGLPLRGLMFVAAFVVVAVIAAALGLVDAFAAWAGPLLPLDPPTSFGYVALAALTSFATELFSNTVIQLAMFEAIGAAPAAAPVRIELMLVVTLSCTCAFMSPLATGVNGLVFGELRGTSLRRMLATGAAMNVVGALVVGLWVHSLAP
jgi:sodium-dependent dicarboxylate transporter 2/3/5